MKNKKGFIRIIEAIFAILVIMSAALILVSNSVQTSDISEEVHEKQRYILEVIANNEAMRQQILGGDTTIADTVMETFEQKSLDKSDLSGDTTLADEFVSKNIPPSWDFSLCVANIDDICNTSPADDRDIYVSEAIISASKTTYTTSKKLRFFIWR